MNLTAGDIHTPPPDARTRIQNNPTLLFAWWCTGFSAVIILVRLFGRKVRSNQLFREDWIMMGAMAPLFARMAFIHVVMLYGTNNVQTADRRMTIDEVEKRVIGSQMILAARIFYAMYIWMSKWTVSEFLKRITMRIWRPSYERTLQGIRIFLIVTFIAVVIATLGECRPFTHYWQVIPDPGPQCRQGFAQLLTMGVCDIITDVLLISFPIPIIMQSGQNWKRKFQLSALFGLSVILIAVTGTRMPSVISHLGRQQYRTVWASCEILASTAVANCVVLGSFLRDKGSKKNKYRAQSTTDSMDRSSHRRPTIGTLQSCSSDEDLFRAMGCRVPEHLQEKKESIPRPAPTATKFPSTGSRDQAPTLPPLRHEMEQCETDSIDSDLSIHKSPLPLQSPNHKTSNDHIPGFFDYGGLLESSQTLSLKSRSRSTTLVEPSMSGTTTQDFASVTPPQLSRRGSNALIADMGGIAPGSARSNGNGTTSPRAPTTPSAARLRTPPTGVLGPTLEKHETHHSLQDAGGLLGGESPRGTYRMPILPPVNQSGASTPRQQARMELSDVGGILSSSHTPDASASALNRATRNGNS